MSAILSSDDLNDFISPGVACIKPVETLPSIKESSNPYEVTTEDKVQPANPPPASISLTDCLACSGCVTSAEAVLISLQSHNEVLNTLDKHPSIDPTYLSNLQNGYLNGYKETVESGKIFVASVSPQVRASLAAALDISDKNAGHVLEQLLAGPQGLRSGGRHGSGFSYIVDTNRMREVCQQLSAEEVIQSREAGTGTPKPILASSCPGWICYAEKTHPHVLPHLSRLKSPQALTGTLLKSVLSKMLKIHPSQIWHLALMPCFDKKLEASREELTDWWWREGTEGEQSPVRDVDCVITTREVLTLANERNISLHGLPQRPLEGTYRPRFPSPELDAFLNSNSTKLSQQSTVESGTSGGYTYHILLSHQRLYPGSTMQVSRGRNADVTEYTLVSSSGQPIIRCARYYGFRNIQNLVRKLKPARPSKLPGAAIRRPAAGRLDSTGLSGSIEHCAYIEVMACPGGCTNGGGQLRLEDMPEQNQAHLENGDMKQTQRPGTQKDWQKLVDEAYYSASSDDTDEASDPEPNDSDPEANDSDADIDMDLDPSPPSHNPDDLSSNPTKPSPDRPSVATLLSTWTTLTSIPLDKLVYTTYRKVESDVGKTTKNLSKEERDTERVVRLSGMSGGGW